MDESKLVEYIQNVQAYGSEADAKRFNRVVRELYNDVRIQKMPTENQEALFDKIYSRYAKNLEIPQETSAIDSVPLVDSGGSVDGDSSLEQQEFLGSEETAERSMGALEEGLKDKIGSGVASAGLNSIMTGAPIGDVLQGSLLAPTTLASMGIGTIGNMMTEGMGFGVNQGFLEKLGTGGASAALGMINPVLGIAASVIGKPLIDLVSDATGLRDLDTMRDSVEDVLGEIGGRQTYADIYNELQASFGKGLEGIREDERGLSIGELADVKRTKIDKQYEDGLIDLKEYNMKIQGLDPLEQLAAKVKTMDIVSSPYERASDSAADKQYNLQNQIQAGYLGITTDELSERRRIAAGLGIDNLTGSAIAQEQENRRRAAAEAAAKAEAERKAAEAKAAAQKAAEQAALRAKATTYKQYKDSGGGGTKSDWSKYGTPNYTPGNERASTYGGSGGDGGSNNVGGSRGSSTGTGGGYNTGGGGVTGL